MPPAQTTDYLVCAAVGFSIFFACGVSLLAPESHFGRAMWRWFSWKRTMDAARRNLGLMTLFGLILGLFGLVSLLRGVVAS
jgi:hypothetical protein